MFESPSARRTRGRSGSVSSRQCYRSNEDNSKGFRNDREVMFRDDSKDGCKAVDQVEISSARGGSRRSGGSG